MWGGGRRRVGKLRDLQLGCDLLFSSGEHWVCLCVFCVCERVMFVVLNLSLFDSSFSVKEMFSYIDCCIPSLLSHGYAPFSWLFFRGIWLGVYFLVCVYVYISCNGSAGSTVAICVCV